jgi:hypothetical protein
MAPTAESTGQDFSQALQSLHPASAQYDDTIRLTEPYVALRWDIPIAWPVNCLKQKPPTHQPATQRPGGHPSDIRLLNHFFYLLAPIAQEMSEMSSAF